jgi:hypothetical protein
MLGVTVEWIGAISEKDKEEFERKLKAIIPDVAIDYETY